MITPSGPGPCSPAPPRGESPHVISDAGDEVLVRCRAIGRSHDATDGIRTVVGDCRVRRSDRIAITGPPGSGKSTLLRVLAGLQTPASGSVVWPGPLEPARGGLLSEMPTMRADLSVRKNVALSAIRVGVTGDEAFERADDSLEAVGVPDVADQPPGTLSDGQAHRVSVAQVLAARPSLILADEPTVRLDRATADEAISLLLGAADVLGAGLIVATHDNTVAARLPTHWSMSDGRLRLSPSATSMEENGRR